jgi:receptor protein-tyrosine kinase
MTAPDQRRTHLVERAMMVGDLSPLPPSPPPQQLSIPPQAPAILMPALTGAGLVALSDGLGRSRVAEEMNLVQQQVLREIEDSHDGHARVVLVTSARPGEGKSFVALNLAAAIASRGHRDVVLVDADGREGALSHRLGAAAPGLRDLVLAPAQAMPGLLRTAAGFLFLPSGGAPGGLPPGAALAGAIARLARLLPGHVLVLDTPPSLSTSDANALAAVAGQVVMVVGAERTRHEEVEAALDVMEACPRLWLLLNRVRLTGSDSFGAHGPYAGGRAS